MNEADAAAGVGIVTLVIYLAIFLVTIIGCWKAYNKAGKPGWACIIPIYNAIVWLQICGRPVWWFILLLIPIVNLIIFIIISIDFAKSFGKGAGFGIGIFLLGFIFIPMIGFGSASYVGPAAAKA